MTKKHFREVFEDILTDAQCDQVFQKIEDRIHIYMMYSEYEQIRKYFEDSGKIEIALLALMRQQAAEEIIHMAATGLSDNDINGLLEKYIDEPLDWIQINGLRSLAEANV